MNRLWNKKTLRRLRMAVGRTHPRVAREASVQRLCSLVKKRTVVIAAAMGGCGLAGFLLCGAVAIKKVSLPAAIGFGAPVWWIIALALAFWLKRVSPAVWPAPDLLALSPVETRLCQEIARSQARKSMLGLAGISGLLTIVCVHGCRLQLQRTEQPYEWTLLFPSAVLLWLHLVVATAALPVIGMKLVKTVSALIPPASFLRRLPYRLAAIGSIGLAAILLAIGHFKSGQYSSLEECGRAFSSILPPAGILLWPARPESPPWWQAGFTAVMVWPALRSFREWRASWCRLPLVDRDMESRWASPYGCGNEYYEEADAEFSAGVAGPALGSPSPQPAKTNELRRALRACLDSHKWGEDRFLVPDVLPLAKHKLLPGRVPLVSGLVGLAVITLLAPPEMRPMGWVWLWAHALTNSWLPSCHAITPLFSPGHGWLALHEWIPIHLRPTWNAVERFQNRTALAILVRGTILCAAGWVTTELAFLIGPHLPFRKPGDFPAWVSFSLAWLALAVFALFVRMGTPHRFGELLNDRTRFILRSRLAYLRVRLIRILGAICVLAATVSLLLSFAELRPASVLLFAALTAGFLILGEILRRLAVRGIFHQWARGRKR